MTLGTGVFASVISSVVLVLAVYNKQFRKVFFWIAGTSAIAAGMFFPGARLYHKHQSKVQAEARRRINACIARFPVPYLFQGQRISAPAIASACSTNPDFAPAPNLSYAASIVEVHGGGTLQITPPQKFSPDGDPDVIPILYLGHRQTFALVCGNYGEQGTSVTVNQGLVSCPAASAEPRDCPQWDNKADKWARYMGLSLGDCTKNGCVVYNGKKVVGGISHNEITSARWDTCENKAAN